MMPFTVLPNLGNPFVRSFAPSNAFVAAGVVLPVLGVANVLAAITLPQIGYAIVSRVAVNVVNFVFRQNAVIPKPNKMMTAIEPAIYSDNIVTVWPVASSKISSQRAANIDFPAKGSVLLNVEKLFYTFLSGVHIVPLLMNFINSVTEKQVSQQP